MKFLLFLCLLFPEITSTAQTTNVRGMNYHLVNSSLPKNISENGNLTNCEYTYDDSQISLLVLILYEKKTEQRTIGFNCKADSFNCCGLGCCPKPKLAEKVGGILIGLFFLGAFFACVIALVFKLIQEAYRGIQRFYRFYRSRNNRQQRDDVSVKTMDTEISNAEEVIGL